ncbi:MAG: hypothetical protein NDI69_05135 [Bacteriovoracaceae bacterium]|nr:hypothetical protein [Bacteriovoracaceae bacterium]
MNHIKMIAATVSLSMLVVSCGSYNDDDSDYSSGTPPQEEQSQEGTFRAVLNPENPDISNATAAAQISIQGDEIKAQVFFGNGEETIHAQHIHSGTRCPTIEDDSNGDGVIDANEAQAVYGPAIIPLDSELSTTIGNFPTGASYVYDESGSFSQLLSNFNLQGLNVEGKVINIHGVPESVELPPTAQGGKAAFPITCGVLQKVD